MKRLFLFQPRISRVGLLAGFLFAFFAVVSPVFSQDDVRVVPDKAAGVVKKDVDSDAGKRPQAQAQQAVEIDATELQKVSAACRVIRDSPQADASAKEHAAQWEKCLRTRLWGDAKARCVGFGKRADGVWFVRVQDFNGQRLELPYDTLDSASQQALKDIWQLKFSILKDAAPILAQQRVEADQRAKDEAARAARRKSNLAAPFPPPDKDGYRVWTNVVGDTIVARIDSFVARRIVISRKGDKYLLDGKPESQLDDLEKAMLATRVCLLERESTVLSPRTQKPNASAKGRRPVKASGSKNAETKQMDPRVAFLCKDGTKVEWPFVALRGSNDDTAGKADDFTTVTTALAKTLKAYGEFATLGFLTGSRSYRVVGDSDEDRALPRVKKAAMETKAFSGATEAEAEAKAEKWLEQEAAAGAKEGYSVTCSAKSTFRGNPESRCTVTIRRQWK